MMNNEKIIPIFPLNSVLFPGQPLRLQIFEERYLQLLEDCWTQEKQFGVVLIREGQEAHGPLAEPYQCGTIAKIQDLYEHQKNKFTIHCLGLERFNITKLITERLYLQAKISFLEFQSYTNTEVQQKTDPLATLMMKYIRTITGKDLSSIQKELPTDPERLIFLAANIIEQPLPDKQKMLEMTDLNFLAQLLIEKYQEKILIAQAILNQKHNGNVDPSLN